MPTTESNPCLIALTPNRSCWNCEQPLPSVPLAVVSTGTKDDSANDLLFLICSRHCARKVCDELALAGAEHETLTTDATSALLRCADVEAVVEGWLDGGIRWYTVLSGTLGRQLVRSLLGVQ